MSISTIQEINFNNRHIGTENDVRNKLTDIIAMGKVVEKLQAFQRTKMTSEMQAAYESRYSGEVENLLTLYAEAQSIWDGIKDVILGDKTVEQNIIDRVIDVDAFALELLKSKTA